MAARHFHQSDGGDPRATGASFTLATPAAADTAYYSVLVSNSPGSITSEPVLVAYAGLPLAESLDAPALSWSTGGDVLWRGVASPSHGGMDSIIATGLTSPRGIVAAPPFCGWW